MRKIVLMSLMVGLFAGCTTTQKSTGIGAISGAALGAVIGHQSGNRDKGALIGGAAGALGGYIVGDKIEDKEREVQIRRENEESSVSY